MKTNRALGMALAAFCALATADPAAAQPERVTQEMWAEAQAHAARLSGGTLSLGNARQTTIRIMPIEELCDLLGKCPHAAAYGFDTAYFRDDRPWRSDRGHHFGIVIHEASHSLQSRVMSQACREVQAHAIQAAWLDEQGASAAAQSVRENVERYDCAAENAPIRAARVIRGQRLP